MTFAARLQALRSAKGLTQKALADAIQTTDAYLSALETGRKLPSYTTTMALARILGCDPQELMALVGQDKLAHAASKEHRKQTALVAAQAAGPSAAPGASDPLVQALADPDFRTAVQQLRQALRGRRRVFILQLLAEFAQETDAAEHR